METTDRRRRAVIVGAFAVLLSHGVAADLVSRVGTGAAEGLESDDAIIEANPALQRLRRENPELLREVLERLRATVPAKSSRRALGGNLPGPATDADREILEENPAFADLYRESAEAALDLLRLIREAAKTQ